jgi:hypothetical protein
VAATAPAAAFPVPGRGGTPPSRAQRRATLLLVLFLLVLPKGGVKLGGVPVTWGYLLLGVLSLALPLAMLRGRAAPLSTLRLVVLAAIFPLQLTIWSSLMVFGVDTVGWLVALFTAFFMLPLMLVLALGPWLDTMDPAYLFRLIRWGVLAVAVYGIFLFFYKLKTGSFIEIPFLTVNQGDVGELEGKHIDRGGVFKLISTYNNGNLYGVSILILLPFYCFLERSRVRTSIVKSSLILSLSRTVWIGLILHELLQRGYVRRINLRALAMLAVGMIPLAAGVWYATEELLGRSLLDFILDSNLGGRAQQLQTLRVSLFPDAPFTGIAEMVYVSVLDGLGVVGLASLVLALATPLALQMLGCTPFARTGLKRSLAAGIATYLVVAASDGAILLIPVMAFYWFVVSLLVSSNPAFEEDADRWEPAPRAPARAAG